MSCHTHLIGSRCSWVFTSSYLHACAVLFDLFDLPSYFDLSFTVFFHSSVLMHLEHYTDLDNVDTVQNNLRNSAKGSNDAYDSLTIHVLCYRWVVYSGRRSTVTDGVCKHHTKKCREHTVKTCVKNGYGKRVGWIDTVSQQGESGRQSGKSKIVQVDRKLNETDANDDGDEDSTPHFTACKALHTEHTHKYIHWERASWARTVMFFVYISFILTLTQVRALPALQSRSSTCHPCVRPLHLELHSTYQLSSCLSSSSSFHLSDEQQP